MAEADLYAQTGTSATGYPIFMPVSAANPLPVDASVSVSASISGFTPGAVAGATLAVSTGSARVLLPAGATILVANPGAALAYVKLGDVTVTATSSDIPIAPGASIGLTPGSNTYLAGITASGTTTLNLAGGGGLVAGTGGTNRGGGVAAWTDASSTTVATTSTQMFPAVAAGTRTAVFIKAPEAADLWVNRQGGTAGIDATGCFKIPAGVVYEGTPGVTMWQQWNYYCATGSLNYTALAQNGV